MPSTSDPASSAAGNAGVTIAQIAALAGVSAATVSKVVNGHVEVAAETRALVERLLREQGYRRQKRVSRSSLVEVLFHELAGTYPVEVVKGVERVVTEHGLTISLSELHGQHIPDRSWIDGLLARRPVGVVAVFSGPTPAQYQQLSSRDIPVVLVDPTGEPAHGMPSVGADNWSGGLAATRHLLELGHRRIAVITGATGMLSGRARLDGYRAAMDAAGVPVDPELVREGRFQIVDGLEHTRELLRLPDPPTAVVTGNDGEALGVYQAVYEAGLRIPDDLSVVGFDDLPPAQWMIPALTTIRQPLGEMAATAAGMVIDLAQGRELPQRRLVLSTELVVRASTAAPGR
ncbi:LacI family transcriptional regulator [Saccharothrix sp. NRRL B-16348]|uniref:LacI family DNA-binding transcriptional regulator n=1 Tax=Saccharothrix sp. NRRL B-16348 TaxID=1415542 RepID=UPI0006AF4681|nr:LacI family DNA-binding transcriptional regulator [Saccharothrix sp. NRRL B-16348]KOX21182.1 LacI family transcriptional regulator [Saccharothrix sp. NRRL B-16348]